MLTTLKNAFKIKEIRVKLLYTLMMLVIIRLGCELPVPGVNRTYFAQWYASQLGDSGIYGWIVHEYVGIRTEHHTIHHIFDHHAITHHRYPQA